VSRQLAVVGFVILAFVAGFFGEDIVNLFNSPAAKPEVEAKNTDKAPSQKATAMTGSKAPSAGEQANAIEKSAVSPYEQFLSGGTLPPQPQPGAAEWKSFTKTMEALSPNRVDQQRRVQQNLYFQKLREQMEEMKLKEPKAPPAAPVPVPNEVAVDDEEFLEGEDELLDDEYLEFDEDELPEDEQYLEDY
jgi:hypothetical protein